MNSIQDIVHDYVPTQFYQRQTYDELARAPMELRKRQEQGEIALSELDKSLAEDQYSEVYGDQVRKKREDYLKMIENYSGELNRSGSGDFALISKIKQAKRDVDLDRSNSGLLGRARNAKMQIGKAEENARALAVGQGWALDVAEQNLAIDKAKFIQREKELLANDPRYTVKEFIPTTPPKRFTPEDMFKNVKDFVGSEADISSVSGPYDEETGIYKVNNTANTSNEKALKKINEFFTSQLSDKNSPYTQDLWYESGQDEAKFQLLLKKRRSQIASLIAANTKKSETKENEFKQLNVPQPQETSYDTTSGGSPSGQNQLLTMSTEDTRSSEVLINNPSGKNPAEMVKVDPGNVSRLRKEMDAMEALHPELIKNSNYASQKETVVRQEQAVKKLRIENKAKIDAYINDRRSSKYFDDYYDNEKRIDEAKKVLKKSKPGSSEYEAYSSYLKAYENHKRNLNEQFEKEAFEELKLNPVEIVSNFARMKWEGKTTNEMNTEVGKLTKGNLMGSMLQTLLGPNAVDKGNYVLNPDADDDSKSEVLSSQGIKDLFDNTENVNIVGIHNATGVSSPSIKLELTKKLKEGTKKYYVNLAIDPESGNVSGDLLDFMYNQANDGFSKRLIENARIYTNKTQVIPDDDVHLSTSTKTRAANSFMQIARNQEVLKKYTGSQREYNGTLSPKDEMQVALTSEGMFVTNYSKAGGSGQYKLYNFGNLVGDAVKLRGHLIQKNNSPVSALTQELIGLTKTIEINHERMTINRNVSAYAPYHKDKKIQATLDRNFIKHTNEFLERVEAFKTGAKDYQGMTLNQVAEEYYRKIKDINLAASSKEAVFKNQKKN